MSSSSSSKKRSRSKDRAKAIAGSSKLRMDIKGPTQKITDPSLPAGRRREIDNVMKKARASPHNINWDKKLLEVEAKDPNRQTNSNRWGHSGYKSLYIDEDSSPSPNHRSRSRSITGRRSPRSPPSRRSPVGRRSPRSPPSRRSPVGRRSPPARRSPVHRSPISRRSPPPLPRSSRPGRPRSPPPSTHHKTTRRSPSASSVSSCSDDSCSVCSPKNRRRPRSRSRSFSVPRSKTKITSKVSSPPPKPRPRPRPPSPTSPPTRRIPKPTTPPLARRPVKPPANSDKPTDPRRQPPPPRPRTRSGEVIDVSGVKPPPPGSKIVRKPKEKGFEPVLLTRIKKEGSRKKRPGSPGADSTASDESSNSSMSPIVATTALTLSERFGKMAQWSVDRERRDIENMRITKTGSNLKVMIEEDEYLYGSPPRRYSLSPVPAGHYPEELISSGQSRLAAWDDVRVRYQYYKDLGYLRDLTLEDYVKWEEWWYKYQDWLANERHYEHWLSTQSRRRSRKRVPATQRLK